MGMPGFTAEISIYKSNRCYMTATPFSPPTAANRRITPALEPIGGGWWCDDDYGVCVYAGENGGGGDGGGRGGGYNCYRSCRDTCPDSCIGNSYDPNADLKCRAACDSACTNECYF